MALFAIADLHLSFSTNKPMDVFGGWSNYVQRLEKHWKALVTEDDTVVIAGDISWAMKLNELYKDFDFINKLPGKKIILKGNHDYWWETKRKIDNYLFENGFSSISILFNNSYSVGKYAICGTRGWALDATEEDDIKILNREIGRLKMSLEEGLKSNLEPLVFLHYPPIYGEYQCDEILNVLKEYNIKRCYYGHLHGANAKKYAINEEIDGIKYKLISCDAVNFTPVYVD